MCLSKSNFYSSLKKQIVKSENNEEADHITFIAVKKKFMKSLINLKLLLKYVIGITFAIRLVTIQFITSSHWNNKSRKNKAKVQGIKVNYYWIEMINTFEENCIPEVPHACTAQYWDCSFSENQIILIFLLIHCSRNYHSV